MIHGVDRLSGVGVVWSVLRQDRDDTRLSEASLVVAPQTYQRPLGGVLSKARKPIAIFVSAILLLCFSLEASHAETTHADLVRALRGLKAARLKIAPTPAHESTGCGVDEEAIRTSVERHAKRNQFRIAGSNEGAHPVLVISVLYFRVKHTRDCTASAEVMLRDTVEYNDAELLLTIFSSQALMTVDKDNLPIRVRETVEGTLYLFFGLWNKANR
jgi:hypothetical protein